MLFIIGSLCLKCAVYSILFTDMLHDIIFYGGLKLCCLKQVQHEFNCGVYMCGNSAEFGSSVELLVGMHVDRVMLVTCSCHCQSVCLSLQWWPVTHQMHTHLVQLHFSTAFYVTY